MVPMATFVDLLLHWSPEPALVQGAEENETHCALWGTGLEGECKANSAGQATL